MAIQNMAIEELTELFRAAGARQPHQWATSQINEGINQLHRFLFLRQAWQCVVSEDDDAWISQAIQHSIDHRGEPYSGVGRALERLKALGARSEDLTDVVRGMQVQLLFGICHQLDDPSLEEGAFANIGWALVETDAVDEPTRRRIAGLHESVLEVDPAGREMRPRADPAQ